MKIKKRAFGTLSSGKKVSLYTVSNKKMSFSVTDFGCCITSLIVPSASGGQDDVVLGYPTLDGYVSNPVFFGCIVGRFANRIANAAFSLSGAEYRLTANDNGNCLHSGNPGYHKMLWDSETYSRSGESGVVFSRTSHAGEQGFPGELDLRVTYALTSNNDLVIRYRARSSEPTPVNLTNHTYFNLAGHGYPTILDHSAQLFSDRYVPVDAQAIPSGTIEDVAGTPFDFRSPKPIGRDIASVPGGYDHTWEINRAGEGPYPVAGIYEPRSGRSLTVYSTQPGVQFYTGNFLAGEKGKDGYVYGKQSGFCLETQHFPDSPNRKEFPDSILLPSETYAHETVWHFDFD